MSRFVPSRLRSGPAAAPVGRLRSASAVDLQIAAELAASRAAAAVVWLPADFVAAPPPAPVADPWDLPAA